VTHIEDDGPLAAAEPMHNDIFSKFENIVNLYICTFDHLSHSTRCIVVSANQWVVAFEQ